jgi:hypothetical protein
MSCFSLLWLEQLLIWLIVVAAVVAIVRLLIPALSGPLGPFGSVVVQALNIIIWAIIAIAVIVLVFDLLSCVVGMPRLAR